MTSTHPERRQVLKAGVWTLPVVAVATAAPAFASSGADMRPSNGTVPTMPFVRTGAAGVFFIDANLTLRNGGTGPTTALTVTITVPTLVSQTAADHVGNGWSVTVLSATAVRFTAPAQLAAGPLPLVVSFGVRRTGGNASDSISAVVDPAGGGIPDTITGNV